MPRCSVVFSYEEHEVEYGADTSPHITENGEYADIPFLTIDGVAIGLTYDLLNGWEIRRFGKAVRVYVRRMCLQEARARHPV